MLSRSVFQPLLWALVGAGLAGGVFFLMNRPQGTEVVISLSTPAPTPSTSSVGPAATPQPRLIDINTATVKDLGALPGIGDVKARAIVDYRAQNGPFQRVDELLNVPGIGPVTYEAIRGLVTVAQQ